MNEPLTEREQAAVARAGGRAITRAVNHFFDEVDSGRLGDHLPDIITANDSPRHKVVGLGSYEGMRHVWATQIDPAFSPNREGWRSKAEQDAHVGWLPGFGNHDPIIKAVLLGEAERMFDWPIYRAAMTAAVTIVRDPDAANDITVTGDVVVVDIDKGGNFADGDVDEDDLDQKVTATEMALSWREQALQMPRGEARNAALEMVDEFDFSDEPEVAETVADEAQARAKFYADLAAREAVEETQS